MDPKDREKEVMEYLNKEFSSFMAGYYYTIEAMVRAILRRYELYDVEDEPRGE